MDYFDNIIGQNRVKRILNFYIESYNITNYIKPLLLCSSRGYGKTTIARSIGKALLNPETKKPKVFLELNMSGVRSVMGFIDSICVPYVFGDQYVTLFLEEIHLADLRVLNWLLSVIPSGDETKTIVNHAGIDYEFNFKKLSIIIATTNPERLSEAFKSRLKRIEIEPYSEEALIDILNKNCLNIKFLSFVEKNIVKVCRESPREVISITKDIKQYSINEGKETFDLLDWNNLKETLGLRPLGLTTHEVEVLRYLNSRGSQSLTSIAAKLGLDPTTVRRDAELFLLKNNLIHIDGKRSITQYGKELLKMIN